MRTVSALLAALTLSSGCMISPDGARTFENCDELSRYMKNAGFRAGMASATAGLSDIGYGGILTTNFDGSDGPSVDTPPVHFTDTNLQEANVDEADLLKTDGTFAYAISGGKLVISQIWPIEEAQQVAALDVDGTAVGVYLHGQTAVVISTLEAGVDPDPRSGVDPTNELAGWHDSPAVAATVVDLADPLEPKVVRETYTTGMLRETRRIGDTLIVVATEDTGPENVDEPETDEQATFRANRALDWLPVRFDNLRTSADDDDWETESEPACDCSRVTAPDGADESIVTAVVALDLTDPTSEFDGGGILGPAEVIYATSGSLYIANQAQGDGGTFDVASWAQTAVHRFGLEGELPTYEASGSVDGVLPDRFGLSEHDGALRVATWTPETISSGVTALDATDLDVLDVLEGLAPGEDLTAARFVGDMGYLVTYVEEKGDPLFTIDLADPTAISVGGELDLPGWSDYLHPMAEPGKLLAVGMDQEFWGDWVLSVSIFDVSDPSQPNMRDRILLEADGSEASTEHHAFTYDPESGYLTIPSTSWNGTALEVVHATAESGLRHEGQLLPPDLGTSDCQDIRRSLHLDDLAWSYSAAGLAAAPLRNPGNIQATVAFEGTNPCAE